MSLDIGRPRFIEVQTALAFHESLIAQFGGSLGVRDMGLLESAIAQPKQGFSGSFAHAFPFEMAAAYAFHIAKNHPFVDGNKRVALMCAGAFLRMNGWDLTSVGEEAADAIVAMVENRLDKPGLAAWFKEHCKERTRFELRDFFSHVTVEMVRDAMNASMVGGKRIREFDASLDEAERAFPLLHGIREQAGQYSLAGRTEDLARCGVEMALLMHLYRIAEDMGYEW